MSSATTISPAKLSRPIGTSGRPAIIDVRGAEDHGADLYRWCRDATDETHTWLSRKPGA